MVNIEKEKFSEVLREYLSKSNISTKTYARAIKCSVHTIERLLNRQTLPTQKMVNETILIVMRGLDEYKKLSEAQKEKLSEALGATGGGTVGLGSLTALISSLGTAGLSGAGITSGLAALGGIVGGGMMAGIMVAGAIPLAGIGVGYGVVKSIKWFATSEKYLNDYEKDIDKIWEEQPYS